MSDSALPRLPERDPDSHKGTFGTALLVGGSRGMTGAVALAGMAALRGGAGLVRLAVADDCLEVVAAIEPSYMTSPLPSDRAGRIAYAALDRIVELAARATVLGCGPGLGRSLGLTALVGRLYQRLAQPMVVDADGLNALSAQPATLARPGGPRILTPHPGEFARLIGRKLEGDARNDAAVKLATRCGIVVVLKGHHTLVTDGLYKTIRNPSYLGLIVSSLGWVLVFRSGAGIVLVALMMVPLVARMNAEEKLLHEHFGSQYDAYCAHTWRLIPGIY